MCNEAALIAGRCINQSVTVNHFEQAVQRVTGGEFDNRRYTLISIFSLRPYCEDVTVLTFVSCIIITPYKKCGD